MLHAIFPAPELSSMTARAAPPAPDGTATRGIGPHRGLRTPEQLATARAFFADDGIVPLSEPFAAASAEVFRQLGSPRRRAADIAIGVTAALRGATLLSRNTRDFSGIPGLDLEGRETTGRN